MGWTGQCDGVYYWHSPYVVRGWVDAFDHWDNGTQYLFQLWRLRWLSNGLLSQLDLYIWSALDTRSMFGTSPGVRSQRLRCLKFTAMMVLCPTNGQRQQIRHI